MGSGGGKGGGKGGGGSASDTMSSGQTSSPYAPLLAAFGKSALPVYQQQTSQVGEALRTGGVNAQIPIINSSIDASREAASTSMESTRSALARAGLSDSSFGQRVLASQQGQEGSFISQIPSQAATSFIGLAPGLTGQGISAAGAAGGLDTHSLGAQTQTGASNSGSSSDQYLQYAMQIGSLIAQAYAT